MADLQLFFGAVALAVVVVVWAMRYTVGGSCATEQMSPTFKTRGVFFDSATRGGKPRGAALWSLALAVCLWVGARRSPL
jgi:hypothetical protein